MLATYNLDIQFSPNHLLRDINLCIKPGEMWGILGANGSGKTTLLKHLSGLNSAKNKAIFLENSPLQHFTKKQLAQKIGFLTQSHSFQFPQTVMEYCLHTRFAQRSYFANETAKDNAFALSILQQFGLTHLQQRCMTSLSGGERQRVAIAAICTQSPTYFLLDEPTNHLDLRHQQQVMRHFKSLSQTTACVMALHDINLAEQYCDHIALIMPSGEILTGKKNVILTNHHLQAAFDCTFSSIEVNAEKWWRIVA